MSLYFITGNQKKADYLAKFLGFPIEHIKLDLDEIQSLNLKEIVEHKARQAYQKVGQPVVVEDVSLEFEALGGLPGPFVKFFLEKMSLLEICSLLNRKKRDAVARAVFGYFDGEDLQLFEGQLVGRIAEKPAGEGGFGWDQIFIPEGFTITRAELNEEQDQETYLKYKPFAQLKQFLASRS